MSCRSHPMPSFTAIALLMLCGATAQSAEFCATNSTQLQAALSSAASNGQHDTIRIANGSYPAPTGGFRHDAMAGNEVFALTISGGWSMFFDNPCGQQLVQSPWGTVLDGGGLDRVLELRTSGQLSVSLLTLVDGSTTSFGGGLLVVRPNGPSGALLLDRLAFLVNVASSGGGLWTQAGDGNITLRNSVFAGNQATFRSGAASFDTTDSDPSISRFIIANTLSNNTSGTANLRVGGFHLLGGGSLVVANNNLWMGNGEPELYVQHTSNQPAFDYQLRNNNVGLRGGVVPTTASGNLDVMPQYTQGLLSFTPVSESPLVDAGLSVGLLNPWQLPTTDIEGRPRNVGQRPDIGAAENPTGPVQVFLDGFED